jgi:hypothetical protein
MNVAILDIPRAEQYGHFSLHCNGQRGALRPCTADLAPFQGVADNLLRGLDKFQQRAACAYHTGMDADSRRSAPLALRQQSIFPVWTGHRYVTRTVCFSSPGRAQAQAGDGLGVINNSWLE